MHENTIEIAGVVHASPVIRTNLFGERFFSFPLDVQRDGKTLFSITVKGHEVLLPNELAPESNVSITGCLRSEFNGKSYDISVAPGDYIEVLANPKHLCKINLEGTICKSPSGSRGFMSFMLKNNDSTFPCFVMGPAAEKAFRENFNLGSFLSIKNGALSKSLCINGYFKKEIFHVW